MGYIVERRIGSGNWHHYSSHGVEWMAINYADSVQEANPNARFRVVDNSGNLKYIT
jgi:hypothetical protein